MRASVAILAFLSGLVLGCALLRFGPPVKESTTGGAFEHVVANRDRYDMIVLGSSTVQVNFVANKFDEAMAERGYPMRTFGFGRAGMHGPEIDYYLERILELDMPKLKWVLVDVSLKQFRELEKDNWYKRRVIEWHAPAQYAFMQRLIFLRHHHFSDEMTWLGPHAAHALLRAANVGAGVEGLESGHLFRTQPSSKIKPRNKFHAGPWVEKHQAKKAAAYKKGRRVHERSVKRLIKARQKKQKRPNNDYPDRFRDRIEAAGLQAGIIVGAMLKDTRVDPKVKGERDLLVFDFNDPERYPELYDVENRYDPVHMTWQGAQLYTSFLVERFVEVLDAQKQKAGDGP